MRFLLGAALGIFALAVLGAAAQAAFVAAEVARSAPVGVGDALGMMGRDVSGFAPLYAAVLAVPFLVGTGLAALAGRRWPEARMMLFMLAGALAPISALLGLQAAFGVAPVHGAQGFGLAAQAAAGVFAGTVSAIVSARPLKR